MPTPTNEQLEKDMDFLYRNVGLNRPSTDPNYDYKPSKGDD